MIPATIDSSGKPGIAGTTRGVDTLDEDDTVTVTTLCEADVLVESWVTLEVDDWETVLLTWTTPVELVELTLLVELVIDVIVETVLLAVVAELLLMDVAVVGVDVVTIWFGLGGSRWYIAESMDVPTGCPTANPSCGPIT
jgi:hypothetical protein